MRNIILIQQKLKQFNIDLYESGAVRFKRDKNKIQTELICD